MAKRSTLQVFIVATLALSLSLIACAGQAPAPTAQPAPAPTGAPAAAPTEAPAAAPTTAPAAKPTAASLTKVTIAQTGEAFVNGANNVARPGNFFKEEGLDLEMVFMDSGGRVNAAVLGGSAHFALLNLGEGINAASQGQPFVALLATNNEHPFSVVMRKDVAQRLGITYQSSVDDKIKALKGLKIGITGPGSGTDLLIRYLLKSNGIDPEKDAEIVAVGSAGLVTGLANKQIDAYTYPSPNPEVSVSKGDAIWLLRGPAGDFKGLKSFPQTGLGSRRDFVEKNPAIVRSVVRAIVKGAKLIKDDPNKAGSLAAALFPNIDATIFAESWKSNLPSYLDPAITKEGFELNVKMLQSAGLNIAPGLTFEQLYIGRFVDEAKKELGFK